jgi:hypothetical protein
MGQLFQLTHLQHLFRLGMAFLERYRARCTALCGNLAIDLPSQLSLWKRAAMNYKNFSALFLVCGYCSHPLKLVRRYRYERQTFHGLVKDPAGNHADWECPGCGNCYYNTTLLPDCRIVEVNAAAFNASIREK